MGRLQTREPCHPSTSCLSPVAMHEPGHAVASQELVVWDHLGGSDARRIGTIPRKTQIEILEVVPASSRTVLTHGRIDAPIAGWICIHSYHVSGGAFVVALHASAKEQ